MPIEDARRNIPSIDQLSQWLPDSFLGVKLPLKIKNTLIKEAIEAFRKSENLTSVSKEEVLKFVEKFFAQFFSGGVRRVINATGILLHTNLGRAPLGAKLINAIAPDIEGYCNIELDLETGERGNRTAFVERILRLMTGAEAACVVNNNAAAVYLMLFSLARSKEVLISRGELVQIGGGFRMPDIMEAAGVVLREVGTTNITHPVDYEKAASDQSTMLLKVHHSNFEMTGHAETPSLKELRRVSDQKKLTLAFDMGHGLLVKNSRFHELSVEEALREGVDIISISTDKLLGGLQGGVLLGKKYLLDKIQKSPLYRAFRVHKLEVLLLEKLLMGKLLGEKNTTEELLERSNEEIKEMAKSVVSSLPSHLKATLVKGHSPVGGGVAPGFEKETTLIQLAPENPESLLKKLRLGNPPIICRMENKKLFLDLGTLLPGEEALLTKVLNTF